MSGRREERFTPGPLDVATYVGIAAMSLLGISGLTTLTLQLIALGLCLLFGILYHFFFRTNRDPGNLNLYFGVQTILLALLFVIGSKSADAFNFLFILLTIHTAAALPAGPAILWIAVYYGVESSLILFYRGWDGLYAVLFYLIAFVVSGFFGYVLQQSEIARDRNQQLVSELQSTQQKLQELAILEERNRLARDLHDSVKQQVFAISMQLSAARTSLTEIDKAYPSVVQAEKLAQQAGTELTALIHQLRPQGLEHKSFTDAIREQVNEWAQMNNLEKSINIEDVSVSPETQQALFRVLQEALANVARHSQAGKVLVRLESRNDHVSLTIEDNGIGFDEEQVTRGIGLDSMKERLAALNGSLEVSSLRAGSAPDQPSGTRVTASVRRS